MAYKDEYEVARLYADPAFARSLKAQFNGKFKIRFHLAPPLLARRDPVTGHLRKRNFGPWLMPAFRILASLRGLRGTAFDIFGHTAERKTERRLIDTYEATFRDGLAKLQPSNHPLFVQLASIPEQIRGFGHVKDAHLAKARAAEAEILAKIQSLPAAQAQPRMAG
jgi:indolepyruvate ferredoxin oxidoreductase